MKYIEKGSEPQSFTDWKNLANDDWKPTFEQLSGQEKKDVKNTLIAEQGGICCYCERKLDYDDTHIEHLNPQCMNEEKRLEFNNFLCSCQKNLQKGEPLHCGNSKGSQVLPITPLDVDCESKFSYTEDGQILGICDDSKKTIEILQLNIDKLNKLRESAIEPFIIDPITFDELSKEESERFAEVYLQQIDGRYNEFYTTIKYLFIV